MSLMASCLRSCERGGTLYASMKSRVSSTNCCAAASHLALLLALRSCDTLRLAFLFLLLYSMPISCRDRRADPYDNRAAPAAQPKPQAPKRHARRESGAYAACTRG